MKQFEYEVAQNIRVWESEHWLNEAGKTGWECYSVLPETIHGENFVTLFVKREVTK